MNTTNSDDSRTLRLKLVAAWAQLRYVPKTAALVWKASRGWTVAWISMLAVQGLLPVGTVLLTRHIVDGVVIAMDGGGDWEAIAPLLIPAGLMGGLLLLTEVLTGLSNLAREHQAELIRDHIASLIHDTSTSVDMAFYDAPDYYDHLHRARREASYRPQKLVDNTGSLFQSGVTLLAMGAVLFRFSGWIPAILFLSTIPALHVVLRHAIAAHKWRLRNTSHERHSWYYDWEMTNDRSAAEIRLFDLGDHFKSLYKRVRSRLRKERIHLARSRSFGEISASLIALLATAGCLAWMGWRALGGLITLGELALFYVAFRQGQMMMRSLLGNVGDIYRNILFLGDLYEFLGLEPTIQAPDRPVDIPSSLEHGIDFKDVTFAYPGAEKKVLDGFHMTIPAGRITAIVGPNGSGKSTLVRLMCRLYDPSAGAVELDGLDLRRFDPRNLRRKLTALFQEPVHFNMTARLNVGFGNLEAGSDAVEEAARSAGSHELLSSLADGYNTVLGRWFEGGTELSVGEWQRVALARAFLRETPIVLLDEPTSAMDSWAETEWMNHLTELAKRRTTVIITHRLTTAMRADLIHVMHNGRVVESGSHAELLAIAGRYKESWDAQIASGKQQSC